jgi:uncharacterized HAD superfamily protein
VFEDAMVQRSREGADGTRPVVGVNCFTVPDADDTLLREEAEAKIEPCADHIETIRRWKEEGHFILIASHRHDRAREATTRWLERIGLPYDELYCAFDKVGHCVEAGVDVLIDDSPETLQKALDAGITAATLLHPWNRELCETEDVVAAKDWPELAAKLERVLA